MFRSAQIVSPWENRTSQSQKHRELSRSPLAIFHVCYQLRTETTTLVGECVSLNFVFSKPSGRNVLRASGNGLPTFFTEHCRQISFRITEQNYEGVIPFNSSQFRSLQTTTLDCGVIPLGGEYVYSLPGSSSGWWHQNDCGMDSKALEIALHMLRTGYWTEVLQFQDNANRQASRSIDTKSKVGLKDSSNEGSNSSKVMWFVSDEIWTSTLLPKSMIGSP